MIQLVGGPLDRTYVPGAPDLPDGECYFVPLDLHTPAPNEAIGNGPYHLYVMAGGRGWYRGTRTIGG